MNFGRAQVEESAQCPVNIDLKLAQISGKEDICYDGSKIRFTLENGVNTKVDGLLVNIVGTEKAESYDLSEAKMERAGSYVGKVDYDSATSGDIRQVKITPVLLLYDEQEICSESSLVVENIRKC